MNNKITNWAIPLCIQTTNHVQYQNIKQELIGLGYSVSEGMPEHYDPAYQYIVTNLRNDMGLIGAISYPYRAYHRMDLNEFQHDLVKPLASMRSSGEFQVGEYLVWKEKIKHFSAKGGALAIIVALDSYVRVNWLDKLSEGQQNGGYSRGDFRRATKEEIINHINKNKVMKETQIPSSMAGCSTPERIPTYYRLIKKYPAGPELGSEVRIVNKNAVLFENGEIKSKAFGTAWVTNPIYDEFWEKVYENPIAKGDYVTCMPDLGGVAGGSGYVSGKTFMVDRIQYGGSRGTVCFPADGNGVYEDSLRRATADEIAKIQVTKLTLGSRSDIIEISKGGIKVGKDYYPLDKIEDIISYYSITTKDVKVYEVSINNDVRCIRIGCIAENHLFSINELKQIRDVKYKIDSK